MSTVNDTELEELNKAYDKRFYHKAFWKKRFALFPHKCDITKKLFWLQFGYRGDRYYFSPADYIEESRWHSNRGHFIWILKGKK